ncbi:hypothetical protein DID88_004082 [Monilinia fructigena]|uniref:Uncharacterized protein n=1 Tax=Monilinia fructigena TaxID=38457 RepID=A0A395IRP5_9HELO|nr:hypothetical protein DID88_004082 [Monilinia fructigena]
MSPLTRYPALDLTESQLALLGKKPGTTDSVTNVYVTGATIVNSSKAIGIKLYPGGSKYGTATVRNVTFNDFTVKNSDWAAQIQSCYNADATYCTSNPSTASVTEVYFTDFKGTTSSKHSPDVANLNCPGGGICDVNFLILVGCANYWVCNFPLCEY